MTDVERQGAHRDRMAALRNGDIEVDLTPDFLPDPADEPLVANSLFTDRVVAAKHGDRVFDIDGDAFIRGADTSVRYYEGCTFCAEQQAKGSTFFPGHKAMDHCRSGGRNHCTCDACF